MKSTQAVQALAALGHDYRLEIYRLLIRQGPEGLPAAAVGDRVGLVPSSLTFHLQGLLRAGLVKRARVSRQLFYSADFKVMNGLVGYLTDECCIAGNACAPECQPARAVRKSKAA
jgi:DNA-binding transcriptional ArsR family regulator